MPRKEPISPYLERPLRSLEDVLRARAGRVPQRHRSSQTPDAENCNASPPPAKSA